MGKAASCFPGAGPNISVFCLAAGLISFYLLALNPLGHDAFLHPRLLLWLVTSLRLITVPKVSNPYNAL